MKVGCWKWFGVDNNATIWKDGKVVKPKELRERDMGHPHMCK